MKQFIVDRHTTPNTPTLEQVPTEKIPIYENRAAVTADLANLSVGQIVATKDTGDELAQPVDVVESGNLHAVSSNAVANALSYSETEQKTGGYWIDGKPIYRKVVKFTFEANTAYIKQVSPDISSNDYQVADLSKSIVIGSYGTRQPWFDNTQSQTVACYIDAGYLNFRTTHPGGTVYIVCEYTKTIA